MRVILLAAILGIAATTVSAQPSKINPLPYGADTPNSSATPAGPAPIVMQVPVLAALPALPARVTELEPGARLASIKVKVARIEPIRSAEHAEKIEPHGATPTEVVNVETRVARLDAPAAPSSEIATADTEPGKMNSEPSPLFPVIYVSVQPGKMNPGVPGLTGAMRYAESPWLDHAMNDLGTNPTGWKRVWCARSLNMWLQKSGRRGCGSDAAISCLEAGERLPAPRVGAIAVLKHHVGIVKEVHDRHVTLVSGNNRGRPGARTVGISKFARANIVGYVWPE